MVEFHTLPIALLMLLIGSVCVVLPLFRRNSPKQAGALSLVTMLRFVAILLLCGAVGGATIVREYKEGKLLALVDISESVDREVGEQLLEKARSIAKEAHAELQLMPFSGAVSDLSAAASAEGSFKSLAARAGHLNVGATNLERAISEGETELSAAGRGRALLLTDGWETEGHLLSQKDFSVAWYPLTLANEEEKSEQLRIVSLRAPLIAGVQRSVEINSVVKNSTAVAQRGTLSIVHGGREIKRENITIPAGKEQLITALSDPSAEGIKEITATFTPADRKFNPSSETIFLSGKKREKVLLLNGAATDARFVERVLTSQSYQVQSVVADPEIGRLPALEQYEAVILNNIAAKQLPARSLGDLKSYVEQGGGLIMLGGERSFGLGGYIRTPVEDVLPVRLMPPQTIQKRLNVAVMLVLDKSGSMGQSSKLEYAKEASREVIRNLKDDDYVGVIGFDSAPWTAVKLSQLRDIRSIALERVGRIYPSGQTNLFPAIEEAERALERAEAGRKHMIILTDGRLPDAGPLYVDKTKEMRLEGISVSTVILGADADFDLLKEMADAGSGRFHSTLNASELPRIFLADIKAASGERTAKEDKEYLVRRGPDDLKSTTIVSFPYLAGYVQTKPREGAQLELLSYDGIKAEPLLASWRFGKGRALAFTSDLNGRWSREWIPWERFSRFVSEIVDAARGSSGGETLKEPEFDLRYSVQGGTLMLDLTVYSDESASAVEATIGTPSRKSEKVSFTMSARGHYMAALPRATAGRYDIQIQVGKAKLTPLAIYLSGELFGERKGEGVNLPLLYRLAERSHGKVNPLPSELQFGEEKRIEKKDLSPVLLGAALFFVLLEILWREVFSRRFRFKLRQRT